MIARHDRIVRWLAQWLSEGRASTPPEIEQVLPSEHGRLDVTFVHEGTPWWVDVAVTSASTECTRSLAARARTDGRAARDEEGVKRSRFRNLAQPFVLEAHGRPGPAAQASIRAFAVDSVIGVSQSAAEAWSSLSSVLQSGTAWVEMTAYGKDPIASRAAQIWIP